MGYVIPRGAYLSMAVRIEMLIAFDYRTLSKQSDKDGESTLVFFKELEEARI